MATAGYSTVLAVLAVASGKPDKSVFASLGNALGLALLSLWIAWQLLSLSGDKLFAGQRKESAAPTPLAGPAPAPLAEPAPAPFAGPAPAEAPAA